jgi:hypothetical protein
LHENKTTKTSQNILAKCRKHGSNGYWKSARRMMFQFTDNSSEQSFGIYAELRGVASEAELERRLNAKKAVCQSSRANFIAAIALIVSVVALVKSFL